MGEVIERESAQFTQRLAAELVAQRAAVDAASLAVAHQAFIDTLACILAGSSSPVVHLLREVVTTGPDLGATAIGLGTRASAADAALLGGTAAHALELDDYTLESMGHPSAVMVPALLAVGERRRCSGGDLMRAYAVGYAATLFFGSILRPPHHFAGFPTSALGTAAAVSTLLDAGEAELRTSIGIAASICTELRANFGTGTKPFLSGRASAAAVLAGQLAHAGLDASLSVLEAPGGLLAACAPVDDDAVEEALRRLGQGAFAAGVAPPTLKKFASCGGTHSIIEAVLRLRPKIDRSTIGEIVVAGPAYYETFLRYHHPTTVAEAKFSAEASVAIALVDGAAGVAQFTEASLRRPEVQDLVGRARLVSDERLSRVFEQERTLPGAVRIETSEGTFATEVLYPPGTAQSPMTMDEVFEKLDHCAGLADRKVDVGALRDEVGGLDTSASLDGLTGVLAGS